MNKYLQRSYNPSFRPDPELSRVYLENGTWDCLRVLFGPIGMSYLIQYDILLWYNTMAEIPGVRNLSDFVPIPLVVYCYGNQFIDVFTVLEYI